MARDHMTKVVDTALELDSLVEAAIHGRKEDMASAFKRLAMNEKAADNVEIALVEELSRGALPAEDREDLMRLVSSVDTVADWLKAAGNNIALLLEAGIESPPPAWA